MTYPEGDMAEPKEHNLSGKPDTKNPEFVQYTNNYLERINKVILDPDKKVQLAQELASERLRMEDTADRDLLTQLFNRRGFFREFDRTLGRFGRKLMDTKRVDNPVAPGSILIIDLDLFKETNDKMGHPFGDDVLRNLAKTLGEQVRPNDIVCRYGGEEFIIVLSECNLDNARGVAERIRKKVPIYISETLNGFEQTTSIGVVQMEPVFMNQLESADVKDRLFNHAFQRADGALRFAKNSGRNRVAFCDSQDELGVLEPDPNTPAKMNVRYQNPSYHPPK